MSHFALVPRADPLKLPSNENEYFSSIRKPSAADTSARVSLADIYQSYAVLYPNPRLAAEREECDRLLLAASATSKTVKLNPPKTTKRGLFSFLWGSNNNNKESGSTMTKERGILDPFDENEGHLLFTENRENDGGGEHGESNNGFSLCGTNHSLDSSCIPPEAHSAARFHMASVRSRGERPNIAKNSWEVAGASTIAVVGLGLIVEFSSNNQNVGEIQYTSDREDLEEYAAATENTMNFQVAYVRSATIGNNLLMISWGLSDGFVVFYRRIVAGDQGDGVRWEAVAVLGPSDAVTQNIGDVFMEESGGSSLLRITDMAPLVVETDTVPAASVAVARLGGYIELVPLPPQMWYGPEIEVPANNSRRRKGRRRQKQQKPPAHYAEGKLINLATNQELVTALTTYQYHSDLICLEAFRTRVGEESTWNSKDYPTGPPAEHILAASGTRDGYGESISFWSVSTIFTDRSSRKEEAENGTGYTLHAILTDVIDIGPVGPDISIFAGKEIMKYWRKPRHVQLREEAGNKTMESHEAIESSTSTASLPITTISVSAPIVSMRFLRNNDNVQMALMDWNGGVSIMDCRLLERIASQCLSEEDFDMLQGDNNETNIPVAPLINRSQLLKHISGHFPARISSLLWLENNLPNSVVGEGSLLVVLVEDPYRLLIIPIVGPGSMGSIATISLVGIVDVAISSVRNSEPLFLGFEDESRNENTLSLFAMQQLEPRQIVETLVDSSKYAEAIAAAGALSMKDQELLSDILETCKKRLWESAQDFDSLSAIADDPYVVEQAYCVVDPKRKTLSHDPLREFRSVHLLALQRAQSARHVVEAKTVAKLRDRLIRLGTYELLCQHFAVEPLCSVFLETMLSSSMLDLAKSFAKANDIAALSVVCFRHRYDVMRTVSIVNEIPLTLPPLLFQHILPVYDECDDVSLFLENLNEPTLRRWPYMIEYLNKNFSIAAVIDEVDKQMVLEHNPSPVNQEKVIEKSKSRKAIIAEWYLSRVRKMEQFSSSLQLVTEFSRLSLTALRIDLENMNASELETIHELHRTMSLAAALQEMILDQMSTNHHPSVIATTNPRHFISMSLAEVVALVFGGQADPAKLFVRYNRYLRPFLEYGMPSCEDIDENVLDQTILSHCVSLLKENEGSEDRSCRAEKLMHAIGFIVAITSLSNTSLEVQTRFVKDKKRLIDFALFVMTELSESVPSLLLSEFETNRMIEALWKLYETLPAKNLGNHQADDKVLEMLSKDADGIFQNLVIVDVLSQWQGCGAFKLLAGKYHHMMEGQHGECLAGLCQTFCAQIDSASCANLEECSQLFVTLLSDINEMNRLCFQNKLPIKTILTKHLFIPLLDRQKVRVLGGFLSVSGCTWIDVEDASRAIASYVESFISCGELLPTQELNMIACQEVFSSWFPDLAAEFHEIRRYLDAAKFIKSTLLTNTSGAGELRKRHPIDVIDSVLSQNPNVIVFDDKNWSSDDLAAASNNAIRIHLMDRHNPCDETERVNRPPAVPARAVFHLAQLLDLTQASSVLAVKCTIIHHGVHACLYGAAAAICRTLILDKNMISLGASLVLKSVAEVVDQPKYGDIATKRELCELVLTKFGSDLSNTKNLLLERILKVFTQSEKVAILHPMRAEAPASGVQRLYKDTLAEYSVNLSELFSVLQSQFSENSIDDTLLDVLSRYGYFWCIAQSTRPKNQIPNAFDMANAESTLVLATCLLLHIQNRAISQGCLLEVRNILNEQAAAALSHKKTLPAKWVEPDADIVRRLIARGYSEFGAKRSVIMSNSSSFNESLQWAIMHSSDSGFDEPIIFLKSHREEIFDLDGIKRLKAALHFAEERQLSTGAFTIADGSLQAKAPNNLGSNSQSKSSSRVVEVHEKIPDGRATKTSFVSNMTESQSRNAPSEKCSTPSSYKSKEEVSNFENCTSSPEAPPTPIAANPRSAIRKNRSDQEKGAIESLSTASITSRRTANQETSANCDTTAAQSSKFYDPNCFSEHDGIVVTSSGSTAKTIAIKPPSPCATDRSSLRERGKAVLKSARVQGAHRPSSEERKKLIAAGRRLLQKTRTSNPPPLLATSSLKDKVQSVNKKEALTQHPSSLISQPADTSSRPITTPPAGLAAAANTETKMAKKTSKEIEDENSDSSGWDFDDF